MGRLQKKKISKNKKKAIGAASKRVSDPVKTTTAVKSSVRPIKSEKKQKVPAAKSTQVKQTSNLLSKTLQFLREVKIELKKVTWPGRKQTIGSTVVVIILVTIIAFFLGAVDIGLSQLVRLILQ